VRFVDFHCIACIALNGRVKNVKIQAICHTEQARVQLPTPADNVALPAFGLRTPGPPDVQQAINKNFSPGRRAHSSKLAAAACGRRKKQADRRISGLTDRRPTVA